MTRPTESTKLSSADADALDALVAAGFQPEGVPPFLRQRAERIASTLELLEPPELADANPAPCRYVVAEEQTLAASDAAALDALVDAGWSARRTSVEHTCRASHIASVLALLETPTSAEREIDAEALIDATLLRIELSARTPAAVAAGRVHRLPRVRLADALSVAAVLLIATSILWPMITGVRRENIRLADQARLQNAGLGFAMYANDHRNRLPAAQASLAGRAPGVIWWNVGEPQRSNSAHLFVLIKDGYVTVEDLASPTNPQAPIRLDAAASMNDWRTSEEVSYSYQLLGRASHRWTTPSRQVVLTNRSPVIEQARHGDAVNPLQNSFSHHSRGQNVLFNDRSVQWLTTPITAWGDNIWLPRSLERRLGATLMGVELPDGADDAFVGP